MFGFEMRRLTRDVGVDGVLDQLRLVGMHACKPLSRCVADFGFVEPEHLLPARRVVHVVRSEIPVPEPIVGAPDRERVSLLAFTQRKLRAAP